MIRQKLLLLLVLTTTVACGSSEKKATQEGQQEVAVSRDIVDTAVANGNFKTLVDLVQKAGLVDTLKSPGPFTVFAPTDAAFAKLPAETVNALVADKEKLKAVLLYHVVTSKVMAKDAVALDGKEVATANGASFKISVKDGAVMVDGAKVGPADVNCSNGVIHVIDSVILPK
jgi:uncharacterized surface protein with fasciclin (FAS1) repeats